MNATTDYIFDADRRIYRRADRSPEETREPERPEDCRIALAIARAADRSSGSPELAALVNDLPTLRHLGTQAPNLLRPLAALLNGPVLEVGSRFGAITRYLGENAPHVVALDRSLGRALATASRCQELRNVETYCEDFERFDTPARFQLITLVDILQGPAAPGTLAHARALLAADGYVLLAVPNRLWSDEAPGPRSLRDWQKMLRASGLEATAVLYPFPDPRRPALLLTDAAFREPRLNIAALIDSAIGAGSGPDPWMRREIPWAMLAESGMAADFTNAFAILARDQRSTAPGFTPACLAYQYSTARLPPYRKQTCIRAEQGRLMVRRRRLHPDLVSPAGYEHLPEDESYVKGRLYSESLLDLLQSGGWSVAAIAEWARPWLDFLRSHALPDLPAQFIDCVPFNLVETPAGALRPIDTEYTCSQPLPLDFVGFRGIWGSLALARSCAPGADRREWRLAELTFAVLAESGIEILSERQPYLMEREADFQHAIVGADRAQVLASLERIPLAGSAAGPVIESQLFWRRADIEFNEPDSQRMQTAGLGERRKVWLRIPPRQEPPAEVRFDISNRAGLARLFHLRLLDDAQKPLWEWDRRVETLAAAAHKEMDFLAAGGSRGGSVLYLRGNDPRLILPIPGELLEPLRRGGFLAAEFAWIGPL